MGVLVYFLRFFSWIFGITIARPDQEQRYALFLVGMLILVAIAAAVVSWLAVHFLT
jgi:hypothetical protein